jgi:hypothetical protein
MDFQEIFTVLTESGLIGYIIGAIGIALISASWKVFKEGREVKIKRDALIKEHGALIEKWPKPALIVYAEESFEFWDALSSFWKTIWKGMKKIFTKK